MLPSVLVANRGEIACRVMRTLDRLGIESIAVYSEADAPTPHVAMADRSICIGPGPAEASYLRGETIVRAAVEMGTAAIHPGYGFLSENAEFARAVEEAGLVFIGPTPHQLDTFGRKTTARTRAAAAGVPLLPGTGALSDAAEAIDAVEGVGLPVIVKSSAGGGGIGMEICRTVDEIGPAISRVRRAAAAAFGSDELFVEHYVREARHIEVQIFGDGSGAVRTLGERDCSVQRRNQKIIEEAPAPGLSDALRDRMTHAARALAESVQYRSAGTVEFVYDVATGDFFFLEVNARLQVEHGVTEEILGIDLVEWMIHVGAGKPLDVLPEPRPRGHAIEARVYAEKPHRGFQPSTGLLTEVSLPPDVRVDTWIERGAEVTPFYDPMLAKLIASGDTREAALRHLREAVAETSIAGIETNLGFLREVLDDPAVERGRATTAHAARVDFQPRGIEVIEPGTFTTVQDHPGRLGYWHVGVPPSGPMDDRSFRLGNQVVGNDPRAAGLECTVTGPTLRFDQPMTICLAGALMAASVDGEPVDYWTPIEIDAGATLELGHARGPGCRTYLLVRGGIDVPLYLGSRSTFVLGQFGGHGGRTLRAGDLLPVGEADHAPLDPAPARSDEVPDLTNAWRIGVLAGPHVDPDYFTASDIAMLYATRWEVHYNSARTGVRLVGPRPDWARQDGGEAGLHPSNIHDNAYAVGTVDFTGDMPIILGPDGPSLGGFVCPATVVAEERWKLGQLRPGDTVQFDLPAESMPAVLAATPEQIDRPSVTYRQAGDEYLLVEYGPDLLDLDLRLRSHSLLQWIEQQELPGIVDLTPGIRSLQLHVDPTLLPVSVALETLRAAERSLPSVDDVAVPSRIVNLPLSWDDPATLEATRRYMQSVRDDAPWCPHNLEFIRRINGLGSIDDVHRIVFDASYLVLGLGDVYLGAPVATPTDPRHRLVTTKYNPARTWTPENAVGIGGAYLCIYGMEGPGGYQFVGRTVPVWNRWRATEHFEQGSPWLLRFFDQIRWFEVTADELLDWRRDLILGRVELDIEETTFSRRDHHRFLAEHGADIAAAKARQQEAFDAERQRWVETGEFAAAESADATAAPSPGLDAGQTDVEVAPGCVAVRAPMGASIWKLEVTVGDQVGAGDLLLVLEAMKTETSVHAPADGVVEHIWCDAGQVVGGGDALLMLRTDPR